MFEKAIFNGWGGVEIFEKIKMDFFSLRKKTVLSVFLCLFLLPSDETLSQPYAYITNGATNRITVIDVNTEAPVPEKEIVVEECDFDGIDTPISVLRSEQPTHDLFVDNSPLDINGFTGYDGGCFPTPDTCFRAEGGKDPRGLTDIILDRSGTKLYVICSGTVYYGYAYSRGLLIPNLPTIRGEPELGTVFLVDIALKDVEAIIPVGDDPQALALSPDGQTLYVANANIPIDFSFNDDGTPVDSNILDDGIADNQIFDYVRIPTPATFSPIRDVGVAQGRGEDSGNSISVINTADNTVRVTVDLSGIAGSDPKELVVSPDGRWLFIGNYDYNIFRDPRDIQSPNYYSPFFDPNDPNPVFAASYFTNLDLDFLDDSPYRGVFNSSSVTVLDLRGDSLPDAIEEPIDFLELEGLDIHDMAVNSAGTRLYIISEYTMYEINEGGAVPIVEVDRGEQYSSNGMRPTEIQKIYTINPSPTEDNPVLTRSPNIQRFSSRLKTTWGLASGSNRVYRLHVSENATLFDSHNHGSAYLTHHHAANLAVSPDETKLFITGQGRSGRGPLINIINLVMATVNQIFIKITDADLGNTDDILRTNARDVNIVMGLNEEVDCADGLDNDFDGEIDCAASECADEAVCQPQPTATDPTEICGDGRDNDFDGRVDCDDADCSTHRRCDETGQTEMICDDRLDNDRDTLIDCNDSDCANDPMCRPAPPDDLCAGRSDGTPADEGMICCDGKARPWTECPPITPLSRASGGGCTVVGSATVAEAATNLLLPMMIFGLAFTLRTIRNRRK